MVTVGGKIEKYRDGNRYLIFMDEDEAIMEVASMLKRDKEKHNEFEYLILPIYDYDKFDREFRMPRV